MVARGRTGLRSASAPLLYTAQDVARFCEVDPKTIHHWADAGKIPLHHRTEGRHLRFRRNHLLHFLRVHGYPLHDAITRARPTVFVADGPTLVIAEELAKKLAARLTVRRFPHAAAAIAQLAAGEPDAIVAALDDPTWAGAATVAALKGDSASCWPAFVVVAEDPSAAPAADRVLLRTDLGRLPLELERILAVARD